LTLEAGKEELSGKAIQEINNPQHG